MTSGFSHKDSIVYHSTRSDYGSSKLWTTFGGLRSLSTLGAMTSRSTALQLEDLLEQYTNCFDWPTAISVMEQASLGGVAMQKHVAGNFAGQQEKLFDA